MKEFGYCRTSTQKQHLDRQITNILAAYPQAEIVTDKYTGTKEDRPGWLRLMKRLKPGDTIIFDSVSRMSRSEDGFRMYRELYDRGVSLVFLKEPHINTEVYRKAAERQLQSIATGDAGADRLMKGIIDAINGYMMDLAQRQIQLAFEQSAKEVEDLHHRTAEGMKAARVRAMAEGRTLEQGGSWHIGTAPGSTLETKKSRAAKDIIRRHAKAFGG